MTSMELCETMMYLWREERREERSYGPKMASVTLIVDRMPSKLSRESY